jgi:peptidoglycan/LPS O-acetylase OafA/YrhL
MTYRKELQGLRAVAVLAVVADHLDARWLTGGFVGVDVFFVISGYLITGLLIEEHQRTGRIALRSFYGRRVRRLLPAALIT